MPPRVRRACRWFMCAALALPAGRAPAQNPDLILSQAERDSILATYRNVFPIWGRKAIERGFDLPWPVGLSVNLVWVSQNIEIKNLGLSTGDNPVVPVEFIQLGEVTAPVVTGNLRADLWVLPFLNLYTFAGRALVNTDVTIVEPITAETTVEQQGIYGGLGLTATMGIKRNWAAFDANWAWTDTDKLNEPVKTRIFGIRYGRAVKLKGTRRMAFWLGAMHQKLNARTSGKVSLSEVIEGGNPEALQASLAGYQASPWYAQLGSAQRQAVDTIAQKILQGDFQDVTINYGLDKGLEDPWNMLAGVTYDWSKRWQARMEVGFIGRVSVLLQGNYRFNW